MIFCTATGRYLSQRLYQRTKLLEQSISMIYTIKTNMEYCNTPVAEMLEKLSSTNGVEKLGFIKNCRERCKEGVEFPVAWDKSIKNSTYINSLQKGDIELLLEFGKSLGTTDLNGQLNICNFYTNQLSQKQNEARERFKSYGKVYSSMGLLLGTAIAIILF
ncbi:MAG: stage III sporulation protein AB [Oscillospiraceae bacterium]